MAKKKAEEAQITIEPPNIQTAEFAVVGTAPLVMQKFSKRVRDGLAAGMTVGKAVTKNRGSKKEPRDFDREFEECIHYGQNGTGTKWVGIPAPAFRNGMISACRVAGYPMTRAKLSIHIEADGYDIEDGTPLVKLSARPPERHETAVRGPNDKPDIRVRPMWREWTAKVRIRYDGDQFTTKDIANLMMRLGVQVGILVGRPDSTNSAGMGWGLFTIKDK